MSKTVTPNNNNKLLLITLGVGIAILAIVGFNLVFSYFSFSNTSVISNQTNETQDIVLSSVSKLASSISNLDFNNTNTNLEALKPGSDKCGNTGDYLTSFNCGTIAKNGTRQFTLVASENVNIPITMPMNEEPSIQFPAWTFNGTVPGPTMRVTEGEHVQITVINSANSSHAHSLHLHSNHPGDMDGTFLSGASGYIAPGDNFTYSFIAGPAGLYPYHCHVSPIENHINRGLYGAFIVDPKLDEDNRPKVDREMVMIMNGYDINLDAELEPTFVIPNNEQANTMMGLNDIPILSSDDDSEDDSESESVETVAEPIELGQERGNEVYTVNGQAFLYMDNKSIPIEAGETVRIYLVNMLEFDLINSFHVHGTMFKYYPAGTQDTAPFVTDIVTLSQGDRGVLDLSFKYPGQFMFHAHVTEFTDLGWMGNFNVTDIGVGTLP